MKSLVMTLCKFTTREEMLYNEHLGTIKNHISSLSKCLYNSVIEKEPLCATWRHRVRNSTLTFLKVMEECITLYLATHDFQGYFCPLTFKGIGFSWKELFDSQKQDLYAGIPTPNKAVLFCLCKGYDLVLWLFWCSNWDTLNPFPIIFSGFSVPPFERLLVQLNTKLNMVSRIF